MPVLVLALWQSQPLIDRGMFDLLNRSRSVGNTRNRQFSEDRDIPTIVFVREPMKCFAFLVLESRALVPIALLTNEYGQQCASQAEEFPHEAPFHGVDAMPFANGGIDETLELLELFLGLEKGLFLGHDHRRLLVATHIE